ncbi:tryptophan synthase subunit alpha [Achromobacter sp. F4_2707]|uniref:tryptophan synthase subunit alpha n=1 Tax=Achromobacter sp. F4_2707 TaxID=3114286 RepID=UPI0039C5CE25
MNASNERLQAAFTRLAGRTALVPYVTAGDPSLDATPKLMHELVKAGADIIELGIPFSDPMADGPVIQRAAERAIARGTTLRHVLEMVAEFRRNDTTTPVVFMGYANPIERMGQQAFVDAAKEVGLDGILVVDYPPEEIAEFAAMLDEASIDPIFLLAPTSTDARMQAVAKVARGYVYYVSLKGVTGAGNLDTDDVARRLSIIRQHVKIPVGVGFGIRDPESAKKVSECADAVVIGSKIIETMEEAVQAAQAEGLSAQESDARAIKAAADWLAGIRAVLG